MDINELDDQAHRLRIEWRKSNQYFVTFTRDLFDLRDRFQRGEYEGWTFGQWLAQKAGLFEDQVLRRIKLFELALAGDERDRLVSAEVQLKAAKAAKLQAERAQREAERQQRRQEEAARKAERARETAARADAERRAKKAASDHRHYEKKKRQKAAAAKVENMTDLGHLGEAIDAGHQRSAAGRQEWIEGILQVAEALARAREQFPSNNAFGDWLRTSMHDHYGHQDRAALIHMGQDISRARNVLSGTDSHSLQLIWRNEFLKGGEDEADRNRFTNVSKTDSIDDGAGDEVIN